MDLESMLDMERGLAVNVADSIRVGCEPGRITYLYDIYVSYLADRLCTNQMYNFKLFKLMKKIYDEHREEKNYFNKNMMEGKNYGFGKN